MKSISILVAIFIMGMSSSSFAFERGEGIFNRNERLMQRSMPESEETLKEESLRNEHSTKQCECHSKQEDSKSA